MQFMCIMICVVADLNIYAIVNKLFRLNVIQEHLFVALDH